MTQAITLTMVTGTLVILLGFALTTGTARQIRGYFAARGAISPSSG